MDQDVADYCTEVEKNILLPGCVGDHVPIVTRALDLMGRRCSTAEVKRIHKIILHESSKYNCNKVIDLVFRIAQFDTAELLKAITLACEHGSIKTLRCLLSKYPCDCQGSLLETLNYGLYLAALNGHAEAVKTLIQEGAVVHVAFAVIAQSSDGEALDDTSLTETERDTIYQTALQAALSCFTPHHIYGLRWISAEERAGREAIVLLLLEHGANVKESKESYSQLLSVAIKHCSDKIVQSMIGKGASLMDTCSGRMLAFEIAAGRELGAAAVMKVLLQAGGYLVESDPSENLIPDNSDLTPILDSALEFFGGTGRNRYFSKDGQFLESESVHDVLYTGPGAVVKMLLQLLPNQKVEDDRYGLLLQMAVSIDDRVLTNLLLERGVNVNAQGYYYGTALQCVARFGHLELVQLLLSLGAEVNIPKGKHGTALRAAVLGRHEKVVDILLQHGADVHLCSSKQRDRSLGSGDILRLALKSPNLFILKSLIAAGADLHAELSDQPPLLITACGLGDLAIVRLFLDNKADVDPPRKRNSHYKYDSRDRDEKASALHMACSAGHEDIARVLLEHGADVQLEVEGIDAKRYSSKTPLQMAAHAGHLSVVKLLINAGARIDHFNSHGTALSIASWMNRLEVVKELLLVRATIFDPSEQWNALAEACRSWSHAIVELLLDELPEILEGRACANALSSTHDDGIFQILLTQYIQVSVSPSTLSLACAASLHGSILALLQRGVDIDGDNFEGGRALQVASYRQKKATVDVLLDHGADVNTLTPKYGSPLQAALEGLTVPLLGAPPEFSTSESKHDQTESYILYVQFYKKLDAEGLAACGHIVRALLARGANANTAPRSFGTPLHLAAFVGDVPIVQQLLGKGADLNSISNRFGTALLAALERENEDVVKLLLHAGIDVDFVSLKHGTALHYACHKQNVRLVNLLLDHGVDPDGICDLHGSPLTASISGQSERYERQDRGKDVAKIILRRGNYMKIAEHDLLAAVKRMGRYRVGPGNLVYGEEVVRLFLEHDQNLWATELILVAAIEHLGPDGTDTLRLLLQRDGGAGVKKAMVEAAKDLKTMEVLLKHRPICPVTPEIVCNFSKNYRSSGHTKPYSNEREFIRLLLDHERNMQITPAVMSTVLETNVEQSPSQQTQNLIEYLFKRNNDLEVTESTVKEARSAIDMRVLLKHAPNMKVTPEMLSAVAGGGTWHRSDVIGRELVLLLLAHDETATIPQSLAKTFPSGNWNTETLKYFTVLLDRAPDLQLSSEFLWTWISNWDCNATPFGIGRLVRQNMNVDKEHLKLFVRHHKTVEFSDDIRRALEGTEDLGPELKSLLYKLEDKGTSVTPGD